MPLLLLVSTEAVATISFVNLRIFPENYEMSMRVAFAITKCIFNISDYCITTILRLGYSQISMYFSQITILRYSVE